MTPKNIEETRQLVERMVTLVLPKILRENVNNIRVGTVIGVNGKSVDVQLDNSQTLNGIRFQQGASPIVGSLATIISNDPYLRGQIRAIIF